MARVQRPGEDDPITTTSPSPRRKKRAPHNPGSNKQNNRGGNNNGGGRRKTLSQSGPITDLPIPALYSSTSGYGRTKTQPFLNTPGGVHHANANPEAYLDYVMARGGVGGTTQGVGWQDFLQNEWPAQVMAAYNRALNTNPELGFMQYMQTTGVPQDARNHVAGPQVPLGTGQPVDTGNPFTSSSGTGPPQAPVTPAPAAPLSPRPNKNRQPQQFRRWRNQNQAAGGGLNKVNPPSGAGATATNLTDPILMARRAYLSRDPVSRGVGGTAAPVPGKWSPWG